MTDAVQTPDDQRVLEPCRVPTAASSGERRADPMDAHESDTEVDVVLTPPSFTELGGQRHSGG